MSHKISVDQMPNGKWRASVHHNGEQLFGEAETPAMAIVELGFFWESKAREQNDIHTLMKVMLDGSS